MALANARAEVLQAILDAALDNAEWDADVINNKVILATLITDETAERTPAEQGQLINLTRPFLADPDVGDPQRFIELREEILRLIRGDQDTGSLQILLEPADARDAGAQWRRTGTTAWFDSGATETDLLTGQQTIEFRTIQGWTAPGALQVDINANQTTALTASYTLPSQITYTVTATAGAGGSISPTSQTVNQGATTSFAVTPDSGYEINAVTGCGGSLSGSLYTTAAITGACTVSASFTQTTGPGTLQVTLEPADAREDGAQWRLAGTTTWLNSGTRQDLPAGGYTVEFRSIEDPADKWDTPPNRSVTVSAGQTTRLSQTYTAAAFTGTGELTVILEPQAARDAGAQWQLRPVDEDEWRDSGSEASITLQGGSYVVDFKPILDWTAPTNRVVSISQLEQTLTVTYRHTVSTEVVDGGGRVSPLRRLVNHQANATFTFIPDEGNQISVSDDCGVNSESLGILEDDNTYSIGPITHNCTISVTFVENGVATGSLQVMIEPSAAVDAGAQWRRANTNPWFNSGETESGIPIGGQTVEFETISGWIKPGNAGVTIIAGETTELTVTYTQQPSAVPAPSLRAFDGETTTLKGSDTQPIYDDDWLVAWYPLDGNTLDQSGYGNHGIYIGGQPSWVENRFNEANRALSFNGSTSGVEIQSFEPVFAGDLTVSMWVYFADDTRAILYGSHSPAISDQRYSVNFEKHEQGQLRLFWNDGELDYRTEEDVVQLNTWHHVQFVRDTTENEFRIYVDGEHQEGFYVWWGNTTTCPLLQSLEPAYQCGVGSDITPEGSFYIGRDTRTGATVLNGKIDDLRIYDAVVDLYK